MSRFSWIGIEGKKGGRAVGAIDFGICLSSNFQTLPKHHPCPITRIGRLKRITD
ncbi:MAG: hypothetical protein JSV05_06430 [Candidatus Bathyarchaeota archaeon]|nr:MAG: hypothetical protein JSV05_06430 [Candidatus Bathyarchaeota archaeon]